MKSMKDLIVEVTALQAVVSVLANEKFDDLRFRQDVMTLVSHLGSTLSPEDAEALQEEAKQLIQG